MGLLSCNGEEGKIIRLEKGLEFPLGVLGGKYPIQPAAQMLLSLEGIPTTKTSEGLRKIRNPGEFCEARKKRVAWRGGTLRAAFTIFRQF